jgi:integrase/recombinase XerD
MKQSPDFPPLLQSFFTQRLIAQRKASPHTIASYRDTFRLLLRFAQERLHKSPSQLAMEDLNAPFLGTFLHNLENHRANGARSRNLRLTAISHDNTRSTEEAQKRDRDRRRKNICEAESRA